MSKSLQAMVHRVMKVSVLSQNREFTNKTSEGQACKCF